MPNNTNVPLLNHPVKEESAFTAGNLMESVRRIRQIPNGGVPRLCILEFDGDLTDWLVARGLAKPFQSWPCFHTTMYAIEAEGVICGIIPRTIGGPYAVLIAEQLAAAGTELIIGLTSAGRVSPELPLPCLVVATSAIRDEGTSLHYLPAGKEVACPAPVVPILERELAATAWTVRCGKVWTTDAPYRETKTQLEQWANEGVLAVEMQAASLFAFGAARGVAVAAVAMVSNAVDQDGEQFDTGSQQDGLRIVEACVRAFTVSSRISKS
ncbi:MAG TPA: nucleoside phosphorylase [Bryobacteraceae bacterium]|nr:nucleoside phosphorylase [Bryobacteraceae bacterium]HXR75494.1 nucleoside phosphorylase [Bryobacteraceae bacterium]